MAVESNSPATEAVASQDLTPPEIVPASSPPVERETCKSCDTKFDGRYCPRCGEKVLHVSDRSLTRLIRTFVGTTFHIDGKLPKSLWLLIMKPGFLAQEYIDGRRTRYMQPIALFLVANLIYFVYHPYDGLNSPLHSQLEQQVYSPLIKDYALRRVEATGLTLDQYANLYDPHSGTISKLLLIILVPLFAVLFAALYYRKERYFFEHLVFSLYFVIFNLWVNWLILPTLVPPALSLADRTGWIEIESVDNVYSVSLHLLVTLVYVYLAANRYYGGRHMDNALRSLVVMVSYFSAIFLYRFILFFVTFLTVSIS